ncbi:MAG TPA: adenylate/guanylate cyclase domain-containing protein [Candidatus Limnocylindrales bacterium]|nr:adenylate/guanylate cyclase domain-containing protein [Candidatus Limnocylindrales bacterium]
MRALLDRTLNRLARVGAHPGDDEDTRLRKALLVLFAVLILPVAAVWAFLYVTFGSPWGWTAAIYAAISIGSILLFAKNRDFDLLLRIQLIDIMLAPTLSMIPIGGIVSAGGVGIWGILAPLGALIFQGAGAGVRWFIVYILIFLGSGIGGVLLAPEKTLPEWFSNLMTVLNITVGGSLIFTILALFAKQREEALAEARTEHERAESLLLNILPGSIAERLKGSPHTIADQFGAASVLFADVVDFTPRTKDVPPAEVVGILDKLFGEFDTLAERYRLEKIKTIGDAYMVASGVPDPRPDHARALALLALDMIAAVSPGGACADLGLQIRIGINSGPVVAGVIGRKKFLYDLWGDAVNTASRMESQGTPNRVQVTESTCELLRDEFELEPRGTIAIKGKGEMPTWYLVGRSRTAIKARATEAA